MEYKLDKQKITQALERLSEELCRRDTVGEICIFGGAAMLLAFDGKFTTRDVDAIFAPKDILSNAILKIAEEMSLPATWLNDGVKGFVSSIHDFTEENMPQFSHLRVIRPTAQYLLAMKCMACRIGGYGERGDITDIKILCDHLNLTNSEQVMNIVLNYYNQKQIPARTQYFIEEIFQDTF